MNDKLPISCFIIAQNEADRINKTINYVKDLVNEIIVIDSGSTDGTQEIAENLGCKVLYNKWNGFGPQKRFGEDCAKNKWLLNLDADEYLSNDLQLEIRDIFSKNLESNFYSMEKFNYQINEEILKGQNIVVITNLNLPKSDKYYFSSAIMDLKNDYITGKDTKVKFHNSS